MTVTANGNAVDAPNKSVTVSGTVSGGNGVAAPPSVTLTLRDDEDTPTVALVLSPSSISETGGVSTVTATLSHPSSEAVTVTVAAAEVAPAVATDFDLSTARTLTIASGSTTSTGAVTVTANGNAVDAPNKSVTVSGTVSGGNGVAAPPSVTLTLRDDEDTPTVALVLSPSSISESGGVTTVTATLSGVSSAAVTVTVAAAEVAPAVATDFDLSTARTLTIAAGSTTSTGAVTVTANGNAVDAPDKSVTVSATVSGGNGVSAPPAVTLTLTDDEDTPMATLVLSPTTIDESGASNASTVTATLSGASSEATTITVSASGSGFTLSSTRTLTIAAGATASAGTVTVTAADDATDSPDKSVTVSGSASNSQGVQQPSAVTLTITDDDAAPGVTLSVASSSIPENGGSTTVSATLTHPSSAATTVTVSAVSGVYTVGSDATIVIAAGSTAAASDTVTITAVDNDVDAADNAVTVAGTAANDQGAGTVSGASLTIADDDTAGFAVSPATSTSSRLRTTESGGTATFTVKLATEPTGNVVLGVASSDATEGTVSPSSLTFTAMTWNTAQTVTLTGVDDAPTNPVDGDTDYTVTLTVNTTSTLDANYDALSAVTVYAVNADNEHGLDVSTVTGQATESGGTATFTVALNTQPSQPVTVTVTSRDASEGAASPSSLTFARADWSTAQAVTVTGANDTIDDGEVTWAVRLDPSSGDADYNGLANVDVSVTTTDDDGAPGVTLTATPSSISENGGVATVTATLSHPSGAATTVTVTAVTGFYTVGSDAVIVIAAGETANATDTATIAAANNDTDAPDRAGTVTATIANDRATADGTTMAVSGGALTVTDDDGAPTVTLSLPYPSIPETGASSVSATLSHPSSAATTVTVTAVTGFYTVGSDATIVIAAGATANATDTVRIRAVNNTKDEPDRTATVTATVTNDRATADGTTMAVSGASLTITDDDATPGVTLSVASSSIPENGGSTTVSATLSHPSSAATTVTVSAVSGVYTVGSDATIVIAAGSTAAASDTVTITAVDNDVDAADNAVTVAGTARNSQGAGTVTGASLTIADDDTAGFAVSPATSTSSRLRTTEDGGTATFTVKLATEPTGDVVLGVASSNTAEGMVSPSSLTFTATAWNTAQTVTLTGMDDAPANPADGSQDYTVTLTVNTTSTVDANYDALPAVAVYAVNADNEYGLDVSSVTGQATEAGGQATFTVALVTRPSQPVTVTVSSRDTSEGAASPSSLTFTASDWGTARTVTVTGADDAIDDGDVTWAVRLDPSSGDGNYNGLANVDVSVTTTDDDAAPTAALSLSPSSISENGGESTVSATLSHPSSAATTVTVGAVTGFTTVGSDTTIVIAAGETANATDTVTVTAVNDNVHQGSGGRSTTVTATVANARATADGTTMAVTGATLTLTDDEALPTVALALSSTSISETGGVATVTATLSGVSSEAVTVTVSATGATAAAGDFSLSSATTLTIASGSTTSSGTVTVSAVGDTTDEPNETVTVSGTVSGGNGVAPPPAVTLMLTDDETLPTVALALSSTSISETGGVATVTATLSGASSEAVTVTVSATGATAAAGDFSLSSAETLTIAAEATSSTGTVTVSAMGDTTDEADETVTVSGAVSGGNGVATPSSVTLTIEDDDAAPGVTLALSPSSISENGGDSTVSATLSHPSSAATTVTVGAVTGFTTVGSDTTIVIAAGETANATDTVAIAAVNDNVHQGSGGRSTTVTATVANARATADGTTMAVTGAALTLTDDEDLPEVALALSSTSISETGGVATVTARLNRASSAATTVTVSATGATAAAGDFSLSSATTLTIASGSTTSSGTVTVSAVGDTTDEPNETVTVSGTVSGGNGVAPPPAVTLTLTDDEALPTVALALSSTSISETGGVATVTATLSGVSSEAVTVTVSATGATAAAGDFSLSSATTLTIASGSTTSSGTVTVSAVGDTTDEADETVSVSGTVSGGNGVSAPPSVTLTIADDDAAPTVSIDSPSVTEGTGATGGTLRFTVVLSAASGKQVTVAYADAGTGTATSGTDYTAIAAGTLTFAAGTTARTIDVTVTGDALDEVDETVAVTLSTPVNATLAAAATGTGTVTDDEALPTVALVLSPATIDESGSGNATTVTATLSGVSSAAVTVTVAASPVASTGAMSGDYMLSTATTLTIASGSTTSAGTVTITAVDNSDDEPDIRVTVSGTASGGNGVANPAGRTLTIRDDEGPPLTTLALSPTSISENGGVSTVTARLNRASSAATTVTVSASGSGFTLSSARTLTIAAGQTASAGTVTVTAADDATDAPNKSVTVSGSASNSQGVQQPSDVTLTIADDDAAPGVTLAVASSSIPENGGSTTVSATLTHPSSAATTVTVGAVSGVYTVGSDATIVIAAGSTAAASDTVTITAVDNDVDAADNAVTVAGTAQNSQGAGTVTGASLTITDDDTAGFAVSPTTSASSRLRTTESSGTDTFTVKLATEPTGNVVLGVASSNTAEGMVSPSSLTFTAMTWNTARTVTLTGVDDAPSNPVDGSQDYTVTLTVNTTSTLDAKYDALPAVTVYAVNADNEYGLDVSSVTGQATEAGGTATFTVALLTEPSQPVTVTVSSRDTSEGAASPSSLTFAATAWNTAQTVTVTGAADDIDDGDVVWKVRLDPSSGDANYNGLANVDVSATTKDGDDAPTATLSLSPSSISEDGGVSTVTATLSHRSVAVTTVTVTAPAMASDYTLSAATMLTIAAGEIASSGLVTIVAVDNDVDAADKTVTVSGVAMNDRAAADSATVAVTPATLTLTDDDTAGFVFDPAESLIVAAGGTATYTVKLSSRPTGTVTVSIASDNGDVTVDTDGVANGDQNRLTFDTMNWNTGQPVSVTAAAGDGLADPVAPLSHRARDAGAERSGYDGVAGALSVAVADGTRIAVPAGTTMQIENIYVVNGQRVTVEALEVPAGVEIDLPPRLAGPVSVTFKPVGNEVPRESGSFRLEHGDERAMVDMNVVPMPAGGVKLCLKPPEGMRDAAGRVSGRGVKLLRYDTGAGAWQAVTKNLDDWDESRSRVCATVKKTSPFAAGYANTEPKFDTTQKDLVFTVDEEIDPPVTLPAAKGGDGTLRYALTPEPPPGVDWAGRQLSGTPTKESGPVTYTWTVTDDDGEKRSLTFDIEVKPALAEARARLKRINESVLPELSRAMWGSVVEAVTGRLEGSGAGGGMADTAAEALRAQERTQDEEGLSWREVLDGRTFAVGLGAGGGSGEGGVGSEGLVVWGGGRGRSLSLDKAALDWSGDLFSAHMGVDGPLGARLRGGLAASWFEGEIAYTDRSGEAAVAGVHESRMTAVHPYAGWSGPDGSLLWGALGYGEGEIEIADAEVVKRFGVQKGDSAFLGAALGGSVPVLSAGALTLTLKGSGEATRYSVADNGEAIAAVSVTTRRLRLSAEGSRPYALSGGGDARAVSGGWRALGRWRRGDGRGCRVGRRARMDAAVAGSVTGSGGGGAWPEAGCACGRR